MADTQEPQLPVAPEEPMSGPEQVIAALKADLEPLMEAAAKTGKEEEVDKVINLWEKAMREEDDHLRKVTEDTFAYLEAAKKEYPEGSPELVEAGQAFDRSMDERKQLKEFWAGLDAYYNATLKTMKENAQTPEISAQEKFKQLSVQFDAELTAAADDDAKRAVCDKYEALVNAITV